ncbi:MAG: ATP-dependent metalloprotease, partial [Gammaproteobacteria bacterium]|nr:ATP-dependent metalloprotease [Gammaproteobacteria bacterium]
SYNEEEGEVFLGHSVTQHKTLSDETAHTIDAEIRSFIDRNYKRAEQILKDNMDKLHAMSDALMKYETIDLSQINDIMEGKTPRPPADWDDDAKNSSGPTAGANTGDSGDSGDTKESGPIGGPASQH